MEERWPSTHKPQLRLSVPYKAGAMSLCVILALMQDAEAEGAEAKGLPQLI